MDRMLIQGARLKELRRENGLTQPDLAVKLNYASYKKISTWENGNTPIPMRDILKLADEFHVDVAYLTGDQDAPKHDYNNTGLSDKAVKKLYEANENKSAFLSVLSAIIEDDSFLLDVAAYALNRYDGTYKPYIRIEDGLNEIIDSETIQRGNQMYIFDDLIRILNTCNKIYREKHTDIINPEKLIKEDTGSREMI